MGLDTSKNAERSQLADIDKPPQPTIEKGGNRRERTLHPGPYIRDHYVIPLNLTAIDLAEQLKMDAVRLAMMLDGAESITVEAAIRLGRVLQVNPMEVMNRQLKHDFALHRSNEELENLPVLRNDGRVGFPKVGYYAGVLIGLRQSWGYGDVVRPETIAFMEDENAANIGLDARRRLYEIKPGARIRVFDRSSTEQPMYVGVVMETLDGKSLMLPYVRPRQWIEWFEKRKRADFIPAPQQENHQNLRHS
jgi:addiction module HigA family antidote